MGQYLNPGNDNFAEALRTENYVDKTTMIQYLNQIARTKNKYISTVQ